MKTGSYGEDLAASYMEKMGMEVIERNFHGRFGEIDIIAWDGDILVFTEVKTRQDKKYGSALEAITPAKLNKIIKTAHFYMEVEDHRDRQIRIDAAEIYLDPEEIKYHKNIYP